MLERSGITVKCPHCDGTGRMAMERASVGDMIQVQRKKAGLTQEQLCEKVLLSRAQIANIEGGRSDIPTKKLLLFAEALGCSARDLLPQ